MKNFTTIDELNVFLADTIKEGTNLHSLQDDFNYNGVLYKRNINRYKYITTGDGEVFTYKVFEAENIDTEYPLITLFSTFIWSGEPQHIFCGIPKDRIVTESQDRPIIDTNLKISFPDLADNEYDAKIDTGADMCCLHADHIKVNGNSVSFGFEDKHITMNLDSTITIQTADHGDSDRPVVKLDVKCSHGVLKGIEFNLNDRSDMPDKILLGANFLKAGNFLIDPIKKIDEGLVEEAFKAILRL